MLLGRLLGFAAFHKTDYFADGNRIRRTSQQISTLGAASRLHEATLFQTCQDQLQEFLGNLLPPRDIGDLDGLPRFLYGKIEHRVERILTLDRDVHWRGIRMPEAKLSISSA